MISAYLLNIPFITKRKKRKIIKYIVESAGDGLSVTSNAIFRMSGDKIIDGILLEFVPGGIYLWHLVFPLFCNTGFHLSFSDRIGGSEGYIFTKNKSEEQIASEIIRSPAMQFIDKTYRPITLVQFIDQLANDKISLQNSSVRMVFAIALMLAGRDDLALENLLLAEGNLHPTWRKAYDELHSAFLMGREETLKIIHRYEEDALRDFVHR